jgi:hypothetical protein
VNDLLRTPPWGVPTWAHWAEHFLRAFFAASRPAGQHEIIPVRWLTPRVATTMSSRLIKLYDPLSRCPIALQHWSLHASERFAPAVSGAGLALEGGFACALHHAMIMVIRLQSGSRWPIWPSVCVHICINGSGWMQRWSALQIIGLGVTGRQC